jgi:hypothetical protein
VDFDEMCCGGYAIEGGCGAVIFIPILKCLSLKILRWMQYLHHSALLNSGLGFVSIVTIIRAVM